MRSLTVSPVMLPVVLALRHFLSWVTCNALAYFVQDRSKSHFSWIYGSACKVPPGFLCNAPANRHSSNFVRVCRKKMHAREN